MNRTFAYSFDRETFFGSFESRAQAFDAAVHRAAELNNQVEQLYVGLRVPGDPQAAGHARDLVKSMRRRASAAQSDVAGSYLSEITSEQQRDLDGAIETAILRWLSNYRLDPSYFRVEAISEHPLPAVAKSVSDNGEADEVHDLGETEYPGR